MNKFPVLIILFALSHYSYCQEKGEDSVFVDLYEKVIFIVDSSRVSSHSDGVPMFDSIIGDTCSRSLTCYKYNDSIYYEHWEWYCRKCTFFQQWYFFSNNPILVIEHGIYGDIQYEYYFYIKDFTVIGSTHSKGFSEILMERKFTEISQRLMVIKTGHNR